MRLARYCTGFLLLLTTTTACLSVTDPGGDHTPTGTFKVLLIGNSLTYQNHLPALLESLADSAGVEDLYVQMVAFPNFALEDHYSQGDAVRAIRKGGWKYVVMQQGPSALLASREHLVHWAGVLATEIRAVNAIPAFYAVWPSSDRYFDFPGVGVAGGLADRCDPSAVRCGWIPPLGPGHLPGRARHAPALLSHPLARGAAFPGGAGQHQGALPGLR